MREEISAERKPTVYNQKGVVLEPVLVQNVGQLLPLMRTHPRAIQVENDLHSIAIFKNIVDQGIRPYQSDSIQGV